jgi:hypothetical protein
MEEDQRAPGSVENFRAVFSPFSDLDTEISGPCGWPLVLPEDGRYTWWVEGPDRMSVPRVMYHQGKAEPPCEPRSIVVPVVAAGKVRLAGEAPIHQSSSFRLLQAPHAATRRSSDLELCGRGLLMPVGRIVGAIFGLESGEYEGLSRPVRLLEGETIAVNPTPPDAARTHLYVLAEIAAAGLPTDDASISLDTGEGGIKKADLVVRNRSHVHAFWYDLQSKVGTVTLASSRVWAPAAEIRLRPGKVEHVVLEMRKLPVLTVDMHLPEELLEEEKVLTVRAEGSGAIRSLDVESGVQSVVLEDLPTQSLKVTLDVGPWSFSETADLRLGEDSRVTFEPAAIRVHGTVFSGKRPVQASLRFKASESVESEWLEVMTEKDGAYDVHLFREGILIVLVSLEGVDWSRPTRISLLGVDDVEHDFMLPDHQVEVRVVDAQAGNPVEAAKIGAHAEEVLTRRRWSTGGTTDADGLLLLPPMDVGTLSMIITAAGYEQTTYETEILEGSERQTVEVFLEPITDALQIRVVDSSGRAVGGAIAALYATLDDHLDWWSGTSDSNGVLRTPQGRGGYLAIKASGRGALLMLLDAVDEPQELEVSLWPPCSPLEIRIVTPDRQPVPGAMVDLWIDGMKVGSRLARWLARTQPRADDNGLWMAREMPTAPIGILAWNPQSVDRSALQSGLLDHRRKLIEPPWPAALIEVPAIYH